jgi:hypothetical protein
MPETIFGRRRGANSVAPANAGTTLMAIGRFSNMAWTQLRDPAYRTTTPRLPA